MHFSIESYNNIYSEQFIIVFFFQIGTPGYQMNGPFTPQTPGTMYDASYSPYQPSPGYQSKSTIHL